MPLALQYSHYLAGGHVDLCVMRYGVLHKRCINLHRSGIHGLGVFLGESVSEGRMLVEYTGETIRAGPMVDMREEFYRKNVRF